MSLSQNKTEDLNYIRKLLQFSKEVKMDVNEILFKEGQEDPHFYILMKGEVEITKRTPEGKEKIIAHVKPGEFIGEGVLSGIIKKPASARTLSSAQLLQFSKEDFDRMTEEEPKTTADFLMSVIDVLHDRLNQSNIRLLTLYEINQLIQANHGDLKGLTQNIIQYLLNVTSSNNGGILVKNKFTNDYRTLYTTSKNWTEDFMIPFKDKEGIVIQNSQQYIIAPLEEMGILMLSRNEGGLHYDEDQLRLLVLVAEEISHAIETGYQKASEKAKNILHQQKVVF